MTRNAGEDEALLRDRPQTSVEEDPDNMREPRVPLFLAARTHDFPCSNAIAHQSNLPTSGTLVYSLIIFSRRSPVLSSSRENAAINGSVNLLFQSVKTLS